MHVHITESKLYNCVLEIKRCQRSIMFSHRPYMCQYTHTNGDTFFVDTACFILFRSGIFFRQCVDILS